MATMPRKKKVSNGFAVSCHHRPLSIYTFSAEPPDDRGPESVVWVIHQKT